MEMIENGMILGQEKYDIQEHPYTITSMSDYDYTLYLAEELFKCIRAAKIHNESGE